MKENKILIAIFIGIATITGIWYFFKWSFLSGLEKALGVELDAEQKENAWLIAKSFTVYGDGDARKLAYILATSYGESRFRSIAEIYGNTEAQSKYWESGYYGRGLSQLTWPGNYEKFGVLLGYDLLNHPDKVLQATLGADILVIGMVRGLFTGKKLSDYINDEETDFYNARRTINGIVPSVASAYAENAQRILGAKQTEP